MKKKTAKTSRGKKKTPKAEAPSSRKPAGRSAKSVRPVASIGPAKATQADFDAVLELIDAARSRAIAAVNTTLIDLYWSIGQFITSKIEAEGWGKGTVQALAEHIGKSKPDARGFSAQNLWRMR